MFKKRGFLLALMAVAVLGLTLASTNISTVYAGTNGQQLGVYAGQWGKVQIEGYNQNGYWVKYPLKTCPNLCNPLIVTAGWWWKGAVKITVWGHFGISTPKVCNVSVPKVWPASTYYVTCTAPPY
jgi:hypothetical protein